MQIQTIPVQYFFVKFSPIVRVRPVIKLSILLFLLTGLWSQAKCQTTGTDQIVLHSVNDIQPVLKSVQSRYGEAESDSLSQFISMSRKRKLFEKLLIGKSIPELVTILRASYRDFTAYERVHNTLYVEIRNEKFFRKNLQHNNMWDILVTLKIRIHNTSADTVRKTWFTVTLFENGHRRIREKEFTADQTILPGDTNDGTYYMDLVHSNNGLGIQAEPKRIVLTDGRNYEVRKNRYLAIFGVNRSD